MKSQDEKFRQKQLKRDFENREKEAFILSLPMNVDNFMDLFNALNETLSSESCDHNLKFTEYF